MTAGNAVRSGTLLALLAALGFGAVAILTSLATDRGVGLMNVLTWRYALATVVLGAWVLWHGAPRVGAAETLKLTVIGGGGQALLVGMALSSLKYIPAGTLAFLFYTYPAWVTLVQVTRGAERLDARRGLALALALGGTAVMVGNPAAGSLDWRGVALALGAAMVYGVYIPVVRAIQKDHPVTFTSALAKLGSGLIFLGLAWLDGSLSLRLAPTAWAAIGALAVVSTVLPSVFFIMALMRLGPVRTAITSTVEPFITAVLGLVVLGQPLTPPTLAGGALIVGAVLLLATAPAAPQEAGAAA